jgi:hypothetical protein
MTSASKTSIALLLLVHCVACGETDIPVDSDDPAAQQTFSSQGEPVRDGKSDRIDADTPAHGEIDGYNTPSLISEDFEHRYDRLPMEGKSAHMPWTGSYWPKQKGGISYRWKTNESHSYRSPTQEQAKSMTPDEVAVLSPSEKYDLFVGAYDFPLTLRVQAENQATEASWTGYCHGWTQAAIHFAEPQPITVTNPDGIEIPFGSSDVKALLTFYQGEVVRTQLSEEQAPYRQTTSAIGTTCSSGHANDPACTDSNPGAFHIVLANLTGLRGESFGIDATTTYEKWNHPVHSYSTQELIRRQPHRNASPKAVQEVVVVSKVTYTIEIEPQWEPAGDMASAQTTKEYTYTLELDAEGRIVGGQWVLLFADEQTMTLHEVTDYFFQLDENQDGKPDLTRDQANQSVWSYFDFPDYVWTQGAGTFGQTFQPAASGYSFLASNATTRRHLHRYMSRLEELLVSSRR